MASDRPRHSRDSGLPGKAVYERYARALHRYLIHRVRRPEDVADLTQEIFELFARRKDRPEVVRDTLAYLFRIAFHVVGAALADAQRNPVTFDSTLLGEDPAATGPSSSAEEAEELAVQEEVKAALSKLPRNHLTALVLVEGRGLSYKEAARISGFAPTTIATYVMHARAALKLALDDADDQRPRGTGAILE